MTCDEFYPHNFCHSNLRMIYSVGIHRNSVDIDCGAPEILFDLRLNDAVIWSLLEQTFIWLARFIRVAFFS